MSWWETVEGDEIGDQPADLVGEQLADMAQKRISVRLPLFTPDLFLATLGAVLGEMTGADRIVLETVDVNGTRTPHLASAKEGHLAQGLRELLAALARCYLQYLDRPPRLSEVCAVFAFVLRPAPERFLDEAEGWQLLQLSVQDPVLARRQLAPADPGETEAP